MSLFNNDTCLLIFNFFLKTQVCASGDISYYMMSWQCRMLPRACRACFYDNIFSPVHLCIWWNCVCKNPKEISGATKSQTQCYQTVKGSKIPKVLSVISLCSISSISFSLCHSCWQSLIILDKLMKSNTEKTTASPSFSLHLPECISVCAYLPVLDVSCPQACQPVNTMMRQ